MQKKIDEMKAKMEKTLDVLAGEFKTLRAGRANPAIIDKVSVDYYGVPTPINQLAVVNVPEARTLTIQPWDSHTLKAIERAINEADIGINPQNDGKIIRLIFPPLTEDKRKEIAKDISRIAEDSKVQIRNVRRDTIEKLKAMKKAGELTEDDEKLGEKKAQESTDRFIKEVDSLTEKKKKEIMEI